MKAEGGRGVFRLRNLKGERQKKTKEFLGILLFLLRNFRHFLWTFPKKAFLCYVTLNGKRDLKITTFLVFFGYFTSQRDEGGVKIPKKQQLRIIRMLFSGRGLKFEKAWRNIWTLTMRVRILEKRYVTYRRSSRGSESKKKRYITWDSSLMCYCRFEP